MINDEVLIKQFIQGDSRAFDSLVKRYHNNIYRMVLRYEKDAFLAGDLTQEVLIKIMMAISKNGYKPNGRFLSWALKIASNHCIDHKRKTANRKLFELALFDHAIEAPSPEMQIVQKETDEELLTLVNKLPAPQREVVFCKFFGNMKFKEIAAVSGTSLNTATGRMRYALSSLKKLKKAC